MNRTVYLVDGSIYIFRAYYSMPDDFVNPQGELVNAVYGFASTLCSLLEQTRAVDIAVTFDESLESSFRNRIYPEYKANRDPAPIELKRQFAWCRSLAESIGIPCYSSSVYEADDLIGTLANQAQQQGRPVCIVSADKDLAQLLSEQDTLWDLARNRKEKPAQIYERFGVRCDQIVDYLALCGDKVDNIPGIPGIGPKGASQLLNHFDTLEAIFERVDEIPFLSIRGAKSMHKKLKTHEQLAWLSQSLTRIHLEADCLDNPSNVRRTSFNLDDANTVLEQHGFGIGLRRRIKQLHELTQDSLKI
ncbi:MAG: 5'-3' exonuclease [bacterium]